MLTPIQRNGNLSAYACLPERRPNIKWDSFTAQFIQSVENKARLDKGRQGVGVTSMIHSQLASILQHDSETMLKFQNCPLAAILTVLAARICDAGVPWGPFY